MNERPQEISERAFEFAVRVVKLCQILDEKPGVSRTLSNQLLRSGTSIGANLEESKGGQSRADYLSKVFIALKEAREMLRLVDTMKAAESQGLRPLADSARHRLIGLIVVRNQMRRQFSAVL